MSDSSSQLAHLHWSSSTACCFCGDPHVPLDLSKLQATPETIAAIFGVRHPENIIVSVLLRLDKQEDGGDGDDHQQDREQQIVPLLVVSVVLEENNTITTVNGNGNDDDGSTSTTFRWNLLPDQHYRVQLISPTTTTTTTTSDNDDDHRESSVSVSLPPPLPPHALVPIHKIFTLIPGTTDEEKGDRLHNLSNNFYAKIWHDPTTPKDFFDKFYSRFASSEIQAFRQYNWLIEVFGGPSLQADAGGDGDGHLSFLRGRVMAKHTSSRMTLEHSMTWLRLMKRSMAEEFPDAPDLIKALERYWLHFYAFFPFTEEERKEIRTFTFSSLSS